MAQIVEARFDGRVFFPVRGLNLRSNRHYTLIIQENQDDRISESAWDILEALKGTVDAPEDWSVEHDHYIYGTSKKHQSG